MDQKQTPLQQSVLLRNNVKVLGSGPRTLLFAHGFGCDQNMWRLVTPAFERDFRLVLFDYVGCGSSDLSAFNAHRYSRLEGYAQDILEICDALDLEDAILVGHSVSAMIGLLAAIRRPGRFSRLIMLGPSPRYLNDAPSYRGGFEQADIEGLLTLMEHNLIGWASQFAPIIMSNPERPELALELEQSFCSTDPVTARVFARATFLADNRADLAQLTIPSLIVQVSDDAIVPMEVGEYLHAHLKDSELVVLEGSGHCPHVSHPEATIAAMKAFLTQEEALV